MDSDSDPESDASEAEQEIPAPPVLRRSSRTPVPTVRTMIDYVPGRGHRSQRYGVFRYGDTTDEPTLIVSTEPRYVLQDLQDMEDEFQQEAQDPDEDIRHVFENIEAYELLEEEAEEEEEEDPENPVMGIPFDPAPYLPPAPPAVPVLPPHLDRMPSGSQLCTCVDTLTGMTCHYPMLIGPEPFCDECLETKIEEAKATLRGLLKRKATVAGIIDLTLE